MQVMHSRTLSSKSQLEDDVKELAEKRETVAQMESQITEIIQWLASSGEDQRIFVFVCC
jgi:hypothetical protein